MRKPIQYNFDDGQLLYASLVRDPCIRVAVEWPSGELFAEWSVPAHSLHLAASEFVARTWGDTRGLMASAMLGTGPSRHEPGDESLMRDFVSGKFGPILPTREDWP